MPPAGVIAILALLLVLLGGLVAWLFLQNRSQAAAIEKELRAQFDQALQRQTALVEQTVRSSAQAEARAALEHWKIENSEAIRQDAINRSQGVTIGKVTEHLTPFLPTWPYNPREARFLGSPIDLLVFDGMEDGEEVELIFVEVKTGSSQLSARQKAIREAINAGRVRWEEFRV